MFSMIRFICADGIVHHAVGVLQSGEDLPAILWTAWSAVLYDKQGSSGEL